ncbi:poly(rC)-binding protein 3 isoform X28 [Sorex araneus]|uniref:poly(rC)-binding protein 3 isoform X28 n=1 Tax=Sorex araneus TaxID=42254 RepID=UPI00243360D7|nr:poly(rC)-binding protein 3 isoform X28 [Sorex araneus]
MGEVFSSSLKEEIGHLSNDIQPTPLTSQSCSVPRLGQTCPEPGDTEGTGLRPRLLLPHRAACLLHPHLQSLPAGDPLWAPSVLPHAPLGAWSPHPQPHLWSKMESKVSEGGLNVTLTIRLLMHGKEVGSIIGKKGETVKKMREESGARINISEGNCPERIVTITGPTDAIFKAFAMIAYKFEESPPKGATIPYRPKPASTPVIFAGGQVRADPLAASTANLSLLLQPPPLPAYTIQGQYAIPHPDQLTKLHQLAMQQTPFPPLGQTNPAFPGEKLPLHSSEEAQNLMGQSSGLDASPPASTHELTIPNDLIGCIIGRQGTKINEIRQMSGAQIKIANATEGSSERQITITGSPANISLAQYLINARLTSEVTGMGAL